MPRVSAIELEAWINAGRFDRVLEATADPEAAEAPGPAMFRGAALVCLGRPDEALPFLRRGEALPGRPALAHHWRGKALDAMSDDVGAADAYRAASLAGEDDHNVRLYADRALKVLGSDTAAAAERARIAGELAALLDDRLQAASRPVAQDRPAVEGLGARLDALTRTCAEQLERLRDLDVRRTWPEPFRLRTEHPVAIRSDDHVHPRGTANDNTRRPRFVAACEQRFGRPLKALDLGCAGGGLVRDFLLRGHRAAGLEGSDFSLREQRAEWRTLPDHLFTCDILQPFTLSEPDGSPAAFDVITAWEVLEHLPREGLPVFFENVRRHLAPDGVFAASVALFEDRDPETGAVWHVTLEPPEWWAQRAAEAGLRTRPSPFAVRDYARGSGNGPLDWDAVLQPELGFHLVLELDPA